MVNTFLACALLINLDIRDIKTPLHCALRIWTTFALSFVLLRLMARYMPWMLEHKTFGRQLAVHSSIVIGIGLLVGPFIEFPPSLPRPKIFIAPKVMVILQLAMYLAVVRILKQQQVAFDTAATLRESELNVLRAQSNPHFLFNTLNLIAAEIPRNPSQAREIVFDLADLLRCSIKTAERKVTTVAEEMEFVRLYLALQQRRFSDRLAFTMSIAPETTRLEIPALLLQPAVENTVKWAVAPFTSKAHIHIESVRHSNELSIIFKDTGPTFDDSAIIDGNGFRILKRTLELNYPGQWRLRLSSTDGGGILCIRLPCREYVWRERDSP
ncbi:MAG: histidine kinase [Myxococcota bacterium]